jgi:hypothetical protein
MSLGILAIYAVQLFLLSLIESHVIVGWGVGMHFFNVPYLSDGIFLNQLWTYFSFMSHLYFAAFFMSSIHRRFGIRALLLIYVAVLLFASTLTYVWTRYNLWGDVLSWLAHQTASGFSLWIFPITLCYILASFFLLQKAEV